jgi:Rrf2 family protein
MRVSAKVDYAVRAGAELAAAAGAGPVKGDSIAQAQGIPLKFLENILLDLKHAGLVQSQRGAEGGYWLARSPEEISLADVIRAVEGPIANVRGSGRAGRVRGRGRGTARRLDRRPRQPASRARDRHAGRCRGR